MTVGGIVSFDVMSGEYEMFNPKFIFQGGLQSLKALNERINKKFWWLAVWGTLLGVVVSFYLAY